MIFQQIDIVSRNRFPITSRKPALAKKLIFSGVVLFTLLTGSCGGKKIPPTNLPDAQLPNPASEYCLKQGHRLEIMTAADGSQSGRCIFQDGSSCDEWAYFRDECAPAPQQEQASPPGSGETPASSISSPYPTEYQGWWIYQHPYYKFTILLPEDWIVQEITSSDTLTGGRLITLHPRYSTSGEQIQITFRRSGEDTLLWPTGVGQGEFIPQETLEIAGEPALRYRLVCPAGETTEIWYHQAEGSPAVSRGDLEFGFIFRASPNHCEPGFSLEGKNQLLGEMIISSLATP